MAELIKLKLPSGRVIEREPRVARLFLKAGAVEIHPAVKPSEIGKGTKPGVKIPPPIKLKEPEVIKPADEYPGEDQDIDKSEEKPTEDIKPDTVKKPVIKKPATKKTVKKTTKK